MIVVVGEPQTDLTVWDDVIEVAPIIIGTEQRQRQTGIKQAMSNAVHLANLGDLVMQNDVSIYRDPYSADPILGSVRSLVPIGSRSSNRLHCCPQAFIIYDEETRRAVIDAWTDSRHQSCIAWSDVPKVDDYIAAHHLNRKVS